MATNVIVVGGFPSITGGGTRFSNICGAFLLDTTESTRVQHLARAAYTWSDLNLQVRINGADAETTVRSRINGANGNQSVSVPAFTTGNFQDKVNSDSIASGDLFNSQTVVGAGTGAYRPTVIAFTMEDTSGDTYVLHAVTGDTQARDTEEFNVLNGAGSTDAFEQSTLYRLRTPTTFTNLRIEVTANGINDASTYRFRVGGADGNLGPSIPALTTGIFEDTSSSDRVPGNTLINIAMQTGMGAHDDTDLTWTYHQLKGESPNRFSMAAGGSSSVGSNSKGFGMLESSVSVTNALEAPMQVQEVKNLYVAENLFVRTQFNTKNGTSICGFRLNQADTALTFSIPSGISGEFEDTETQINLVATDDIAYWLDTSPSTSGVLLVLMYGVQMSQPPPVASPSQDMVGSTTWGIARPLRVLAY